MMQPKPGWHAVITAEYFSEHFSTLGPFRPSRTQRFMPYAVRVAYAGRGRHHASRTRRPSAWAVSILRDVGEALFGSFTTPEEAR